MDNNTNQPLPFSPVAATGHFPLRVPRRQCHDKMRPGYWRELLKRVRAAKQLPETDIERPEPLF